MNWRAISTIVRKDLKMVLQSRPVVVPLIVVPLIFFVIMPLMVALVPKLALTPEAMNLPSMERILARGPEGLRAALAGLTTIQAFAVWWLVYLMAPFFLIVPLMVASVVAADSFAGEKERKTLEALLYTPTSDVDLFVAKVLGAWLPALGVTLAGFLVYTLVADVTAWNMLHRILLPNWIWTAMVIWVAPPAAGLGLSTMVLVSSRVRTFQEAYQLGALVVLPVVALVIGQTTGVMYLSLELVLGLGLGLWVLDACLLWFGVRTFRRGELIAQL
jgi:ABC-2 type transport system permease protein